MVKPLAVEEIDNTNKPQEEVTTAGSVKKGTESKGEDLIHKLNKPSRVIFPEAKDHSNLHDPFESIPSGEVSIEQNESITSGPFHLLPDSNVQSHSPGRLVGQCILPQIAIQDENSISTLVSDTSDGEQYFTRRNKHDKKTEAHLLTHSADGKDDWDRDSACSSDVAQEGGEGTDSKALKHKSSKKQKKDQKSDGVERLVLQTHEGPILDIKVSLIIVFKIKKSKVILWQTLHFFYTVLDNGSSIQDIPLGNLPYFGRTFPQFNNVDITRPSYI
jgi:hypothetical protein